MKKNAITAETEKECKRIIDDIKAEFKPLRYYRIPPQFFGPASTQATKLFLDQEFQQFDYESVNYVVDFGKGEAEDDRLQVGIFQREKRVEHKFVGKKRPFNIFHQEQDEADYLETDSQRLKKYEENMSDIYQYYSRQAKNKEINRFQDEKKWHEAAREKEELKKQERRRIWEERINKARENGTLITWKKQGEEKKIEGNPK